MDFSGIAVLGSHLEPECKWTVRQGVGMCICTKQNRLREGRRSLY